MEEYQDPENNDQQEEQNSRDISEQQFYDQEEELPAVEPLRISEDLQKSEHLLETVQPDEGAYILESDYKGDQEERPEDISAKKVIEYEESPDKDDDSMELPSEEIRTKSDQFFD